MGPAGTEVTTGRDLGGHVWSKERSQNHQELVNSHQWLKYHLPNIYQCCFYGPKCHHLNCVPATVLFYMC